MSGGAVQVGRGWLCTCACLSPSHHPLSSHPSIHPPKNKTKPQKVLGRALARLPRDQVVVATKVGRYGPDAFDFSAGATHKSVSESCARLGTPRLDLVQCHDIEFGDLKEVVTGALPALAALKAKGVVGAVGVTGLPLATLKKVVDLLRFCFCFLSFFDLSILSLATTPPTHVKNLRFLFHNHLQRPARPHRRRPVLLPLLPGRPQPRGRPALVC